MVEVGVASENADFLQPSGIVRWTELLAHINLNCKEKVKKKANVPNNCYQETFLKLSKVASYTE